MSHLGSSKWWWAVGFDGIGSSLIAAAIAVIAVLWGWKHDRRLSEEAARRDRELAEEFAFREECTSLSSTARVLDRLFAAELKADRGWTTVHDRMLEFAIDLKNLAVWRTETEPNLARIIDAAAELILYSFWGKDSDSGKLDRGLVTVRSTLEERVRMPELLRALTVEQVDVLLEPLKARSNGSTT